MTRTVLDVTRLTTRAGHAVATGVDRVELAYARRALAQEPGRVGFAAIVAGRAVPVAHETVARFVEALDAKWRGGRGDHRAATKLARKLGAALDLPAPTPSPTLDDALRGALNLRGQALLGASRTAVAAGETYLHVSHIRLDRPQVFSRIRDAGARVVMLIHDLIPIRFPEYARPGEDERHRRRMTTALHAADALIANSDDTARDLAAFAAEIGVARPPTIAAPLGLEAGFAADVAPLGAERPYFVTLGTIEPRKNHLLLLHVWRRLAARLGPATPTLVIVGRRGWENEMVVDLLERSPGVQDHVIETNDLPDTALAALVKGARALLFPSFAEGYGLPLAEALALGVPALASDLPAFREVAGDGAVETLDPLDGPAWESAVVDYASEPSPRRAAALARVAGYRPPSWDEHFDAVREITGLA